MNEDNSQAELFITTRGSFKWLGSFDELKKFCDKILKIDSRWLVPGGGCKSFENEDITIRWYSTNNSLIIKGQDGESLRNELKLIANPMDESVGDSQDDELISAEGDGDSIASTQIHGKVDEVVQSEESPQVTAKDPSDYVYFQNQVSEIKSNLDQHIDKTRAELQRIEESLADQFDQLKELQFNERTNELAKYCLSNLETQNCQLKQENIQLRIDNDILKDRLNSVSYVVSDLNTKIKDIESEKLSIVTAIKLLQEDNNLAAINNRDSASSSWQTSRSKAQSNAHNISSNDEHNITVRMTDQHNQAPEAVTKTSNTFDILSVESCSDESDTNVDDSTLKLNTVLSSESGLHSPNVDSRKYDSAQKKNQSTQSYGQSNKSNSKFNGNNRSYRTANSKRAATSQKGTTNQPSKLVFIAGDSIVQHVHGWELSDAERRVAVKSFSGSKIDILALNVIRLNNNITNQDMFIHNYDLIRADRSRTGGGVCLYIRNAINYFERKDLNRDNLEAVCIEVNKPSSASFIVGTIYRPPGASVDSFANIEQLIKLIDDENRNFTCLVI